ncbi:MAG: hypothetical protein ACC655_00120 [Rhodothermia bacterium]
MKKALVIVSTISILLVLAMVWIGARSIDRERISELENEIVLVQAKRDSILTAVAFKDSLQGLIQAQVDLKADEADELRREVAQLEQERREQELAVRRLNSFQAVEAKFLDTYPALERTARLMTVRRGGFDLQFIGIPLAATETFVIEHNDAVSYRAQRDTLLELDSLNLELIALKDTMFVLERQKVEAYRLGYEDAFGRYENLNAEYISTLKSPCVSVFPNKSTAIIAGSIGIVAGVAVGSIVTSATQ